MTYRTMLKSKIHRATVTEANIDYEGSITIDSTIMDAADILEHEKVHVLSLSNGNRLETYAIRGHADRGGICINGAAAKLIAAGEKVIIISYALVGEEDAHAHQAKVVLVDDVNHINAVSVKRAAFDIC